MNHIFAGLIVIGIVFGVFTAFDKTADITYVNQQIAQIDLALDSPWTDEESTTAQLTRLDSVLTTLNSEGVRLPLGLGQRLEKFEIDVEEALESPPADGEAFRATLTERWGAFEEYRDLDGTKLTAASLSQQGFTMFDKFMDLSGTAVEICFGLIGIMALWLGLMRVAEEAGLIQILAAMIRPILHFLFPKVPKGHPAEGALMMSMAANIMGLDNAGTPLGLKAMQELQTLNKEKDTITDDQAMLLALSTSSINLIPFSIIAYRVTEGSTRPSDIIIPTIIATTASTVVAVTLCKVFSKFSQDTAAVGAEAEAIRDKILAEIEAHAHGVDTEEKEG